MGQRPPIRTNSTTRQMVSGLDERATTEAHVESVECLPGFNPTLLLICEHAGWMIPPGWNNLGLDETFLATHFATDLGAYALSIELARRLDAPLVGARFSRLFFDINRHPGDWERIRSDMSGIPIPGNQDLTDAEHALRDSIAREPFDRKVRELLQNRWGMVSIHSFSPVYDGKVRQTDIGILHFDDCPMGASLLRALSGVPEIIVGDNVPYDIRSAPEGTIRRILPRQEKPAVAIEVRNDLLADEQGIARIAGLLCDALLVLPSEAT